MTREVWAETVSLSLWLIASSQPRRSSSLRGTPSQFWQGRVRLRFEADRNRILTYRISFFQYLIWGEIDPHLQMRFPTLKRAYSLWWTYHMNLHPSQPRRWERSQTWYRAPMRLKWWRFDGDVLKWRIECQYNDKNHGRRRIRMQFATTRSNWPSLLVVHPG